MTPAAMRLLRIFLWRGVKLYLTWRFRKLRGYVRVVTAASAAFSAVAFVVRRLRR